MFHFLVILGTSLVVVQLVMFLFWVDYWIRRNIGGLDLAWGLGFIAAVTVDFFLGEGFFWRKLLVLIIVFTWALRSIKYLSHRLSQEDPRYARVLEKWPFKGHPHFQVLTLFALQGFIITVLSLPFALMSENPSTVFTTCEIFGLLIWMVGLIGEAIADRQLEQFKQMPEHSHQVCEIGLWKYSRHPNYFFEWIIWIGYGVMALSSPFGFLGLIAPILILFLLLKITGIPLAEEQALITKGDAYRDYQRRTSPFFPWFYRSISIENKADQDNK